MMRAWLEARSRFADQPARATEGGVRQYVVFGAGLETFGFRNPHPALEVCEVDHPATHSWKKELAEASGVVIPETFHFVAVDFETQKLSERLEEAGLDAKVPTVFAMLGVVMYLTPDAF